MKVRIVDFEIVGEITEVRGHLDRHHMKSELRLRIVVRRPPSEVVFRLQQGRSKLIPPSAATSDSLSFEFTVRMVLTPGEEPNFLGELAQGPRSARFVYENSGRHAGQIRRGIAARKCP